MRGFCGWQSWTAIIIGRRQEVGASGRQLGQERERGMRGNYSKKLLTLGVESFVTLPSSTNGGGAEEEDDVWLMWRRWQVRRIGWWGWCRRRRRRRRRRCRGDGGPRQSKQSLTNTCTTTEPQLQVDWDERSSSYHPQQMWRVGGNKAKLTKLTFGVATQPFESRHWPRAGRGLRLPKHFCPAAKNFSLSISRLPVDKVGYRVIVRLLEHSPFLVTWESKLLWNKFSLFFLLILTYLLKLDLKFKLVTFKATFTIFYIS